MRRVFSLGREGCEYTVVGDGVTSRCVGTARVDGTSSMMQMAIIALARINGAALMTLTTKDYFLRVDLNLAVAFLYTMIICH